MLVFVTIGSTRFDALITSIFTEQVLVSFQRKGYTNLVVQCGNSAFELAECVKNGETVSMSRWGMTIELWKFKNSLEQEFEKADLIISHAGRSTYWIRRIVSCIEQDRGPYWKFCARAN